LQLCTDQVLGNPASFASFTGNLQQVLDELLSGFGGVIQDFKSLPTVKLSNLLNQELLQAFNDSDPLSGRKTQQIRLLKIAKHTADVAGSPAVGPTTFSKEWPSLSKAG
jgi:hypothetical protein